MVGHWKLNAYHQSVTGHFVQMGTNSVLPKFGIVLKAVTACGLLPFTWNVSTGQLKSCGIWKRLYWIIFAPIAQIVQLLGGVALWHKVLAQAGSDISSNSRTLAALALATILVNAMAVSLVFDYNSLRLGDEIILYYNSILAYRAHLTSALKMKLKRDFVVLTTYLIFLIPRCIVLAISAAQHPERPPHLPSVLPAAWRTDLLIFMFVPTYTLSYWAMYVMILFMTSIFSLHIETLDQDLRFRLSELRHGAAGDDIFQVYAGWRLLNQRFDSSYGRPTFGFHIASLAVFIITSAYGLIRCFGKIPFKLYAAFITPLVCISLLAATFMTVGARVHENSMKMKRMISRVLLGSPTIASLIERPGNSIAENNLLYRKYIRMKLHALPDLHILVGGYFPIVRISYVTFIGYCSVNAISLLINF